MQPDALIEFCDVTIKTPQEVPIISSASFCIQSGQKVLISGPSGSGKSTLLLSILGYYRPASGAIYFKGDLLSASNISKLRNAAAYIPQIPISEAETVYDALMLPFTFKANKNNKPDRMQLSQALAQSGFSSDILERKTESLSGGEKQRIALVRTMLLNREILIVDEPAASLDKINEENVLRMLLENNKTVIAVSHNPEWRNSFDMIISIFEKRVKVE